VFWQDRTENRRLENWLLQVGKLAAIGQLAAGVAHEINNPLTAVNANAELLKLTIPKTDDNYESVDLIARGGQRAAKVVRGLLDFARQEEYHLDYGDINDSITRTLDLVQYQLNSAQVELDLQLSDNLPPIAASWEHLKGVWLNLFINARDALRDAPRPRQLTIITRFAPDDADAVQILIQDSGSGISNAELPHIFDPFYTTKAPGQGTGLGLATSHRIIEQHGGIINAISTADDGTTFIIHLPINGQLTINS
jgi:two-component system NtrC family sensor kinase